MNYKNIYNNLIFKAQNRTLDKNIYSEKHHIIPVCIDATMRKDKNNIVKLLAREHFIAHLLLCKVYPKKQKLKCALFMMCNFKKYNIINNKLYEKYRNETRGYLSSLYKNKTLEELHGEEEANRIKLVIKNNNLGKKRTEKQKLNYKGAKSSEHKKNISLAHKGKPKKYITYWKDKKIPKKVKEKIRNTIINNNIVKGANNPRAKTYIFYSPCGIKHIIKGELKRFCKMQGLGWWSINEILNHNKENKYKGWKIFKGEIYGY